MSFSWFNYYPVVAINHRFCIERNNIKQYGVFTLLYTYSTMPDAMSNNLGYIYNIDTMFTQWVERTIQNCESCSRDSLIASLVFLFHSKLATQI